MRSEFALAAWRLDQERELAKVDQAYAAYPPGKVLYAQSKTIPVRRRSGIVFSTKGRVEVLVVDASDEDVAKAVANGASVVTPMGAKAIAEDDALVVFETARTDTSQVERLLAEQTAENIALRAELEALRSKRRDKDPDAVRPERLATKPGPAPAPKSEADEIIAGAKAEQAAPKK